MDHIAAAEQQIVTERLTRKLEQVNEAAESLLEPIHDHVNFNLQKAYFKCAHECFDRSRRQAEINNCVENCSVPVVTANDVVQTEMAKFQISECVAGRNDSCSLGVHTRRTHPSIVFGSCDRGVGPIGSSDGRKSRPIRMPGEESQDGNVHMADSTTMYQERMNRSFMVCQDKFEAAKLQNIKTEAVQNLESCVGRAIEEKIQILPHIVDHLKASLSIE